MIFLQVVFVDMLKCIVYEVIQSDFLIPQVEKPLQVNHPKKATVSWQVQYVFSCPNYGPMGINYDHFSDSQVLSAPNFLWHRYWPSFAYNCFKRDHTYGEVEIVA